MDHITEILTLPIFRNSLIDWIIACAVGTALFVVLLIARGTIRRYHTILKRTEKIEWTEMPVEILSRTSVLFFLVVSLFAGLSTLSMSTGTAKVLSAAATIALFVQVGTWAGAASTLMLEHRRRRALGSDRAVASSLGIIGFLMRMAIWVVIVLLVLDNLGIDVTALIAGLGIGGIAVALASQNILSDLFASLSIIFDRPFVIGDFLILDDYMGSVEYIGVKSTRVRSLSGEQIILSNAELLKSRMRNYGRMVERRVAFTLNVTYETDSDLLERIPKEIQRIVESQKDTRFDRSHFAKYGPHSLDFETVYYVLSADYNRYMDIQQAINLSIFREFERLKVEFAYPTQKLYLNRT